MVEGLMWKNADQTAETLMAFSDHDSLWYARRNGTVRGPFTDERIARYILLGRIRLNDELSLDRVRWQSVREYPELFPNELLQLSSWEDYQKLVVARMKVDERTSQRRQNRGNNPLPDREERRKQSDRRQNDCDAEFFKYHLIDDMSLNPRGVQNRQGQSLRTFLLATLLLTLVLAYFSISTR
jgi:hypothetical protein